MSTDLSKSKQHGEDVSVILENRSTHDSASAIRRMTRGSIVDAPGLEILVELLLRSSFDHGVDFSFFDREVELSNDDDLGRENDERLSIESTILLSTEETSLENS